jgi:hypothetical protein
MADSAPASAPRNGKALRTAALFAVAYALPWVIGKAHVFAALQRLLRAQLGDQPQVFYQMEQLLWMWGDTLRASYAATLFVASLAASLGLVARTLARARVRAGLPDPLDRVRSFVAARPRWARALTAAPAALGVLLSVASYLRFFRYWPEGKAELMVSSLVPGLVLPGAIALVAQLALTRRGVRALLGATRDHDETARAEVTADGYEFDAVAVTTETRAAVAAMAALPFVFFGILTLLSKAHVLRGTGDLAVIAAYVATTLAGVALFTRKSRIAVGVDGILIKGSSRERFFGYREVDGARSRGGNIELLRGTRVLLRLQLHGKDAARREALLARIEAAISVAAEVREQPSTSFVATASRAQLTQIAHGGGDYRQAAMSREQLWELLEGPAIDNATRRAAGEALAMTDDPSERRRLRVAADRCAEPAVRVRLQALLEDDDDPAALDDDLEAAPAQPLSDESGRALAARVSSRRLSGL